MNTGRFSKLFFFVHMLALTAASQGAVGTWSVQTNLPQWNTTLGVTQTRQGCSSTPDSCLQFVGGVAKANNAKVFLAIPLDASTTAAAALQYSRLSVAAPYLAEVGIDDFVDQYKALFSVSGVQPATLLSTVIGNLKSANPNLKFGGTIYEDQLQNAYLQDARLPAALRNQFDYVHLFVHYRAQGPNFPSYVQQARQLFPNARIIAGAYAYDRRYYLPCSPNGQPCTAAQELALFRQTIAIQAQLMRAGTVDSIEFYPGYFGTEDQWDGWTNPKECDPGDVPACIENTRNLRQEAAIAVGPSYSGSELWQALVPDGPVPTPRSGHSAALDPASHRMIVFGGTSDSGDLNDTWILNNASGAGTPSWLPLITATAPPTDYYSAGMFDSGSNRMIIYGGDSGTDVWVLTNANGIGGDSSWVQIPATGATPDPLSDWQKQVYDPVNNLLIVYDFSNSLWTLSSANGLGGPAVWNQINISNDGPPSRTAFSAVYNPKSSQLVIFGGSDGTTDYNDVWVLSSANGIAGAPTWTNVVAQGASGSPAGRSGHTAVYDPTRDVMTIFGGLGQPADTWMLANATGAGGTPLWTQVNASLIGPDPRSDTSAVLDTSNGAMVIFGGVADDFLNDAWTLGSAAWTWWPDPATHRGLSAWVNFSSDYDSLWSNQLAVDREVNAMSQHGIEVALLSISSAAGRTHLQALASRNDSVTLNMQYLLNALAAHHIKACASILSDNFTGSASQMQRFNLVDSLIAFNASRGSGDAGFTCVATDLEMAAGSRTTAVYDLWKQFHVSLRNRIASLGGELKLLAWFQGPDFLLAQMSPADRSQLMQREGIVQNTADSSLYDGALRYFVTGGGEAIFDAVIPMLYFTPTDPYYRFLNHNASELQKLQMPGLYLIDGILTRNSTGECCPGCVAGSPDYLNRLSYNDTLRQQYPALIGTAVFMWPIDSQWTCQ